jgi:EAL domain-containing protein (putative c-di-GMP-specific phosphodiesterase class I)
MGFLHEPHVDARATVDDVASRLAEVDGGGEVAVAHRTVRMDPGPLNEADGGKAIRFAIQRFADSGAEGFGVGTAEDGLKLLLADTVARLTAFREIMAANSFRLVFQPILALRDREVHHWEALTRFGASESPADVIKFAEGVNVIDELDLAVVASVLTTLQARAARGLRDRVAVNLSARTIDSDLFLAALDDVLVRHEDVRDQVLFEITETASITDLERAAKVLQRLRQRGNAVCLDDFGAGATSIPYLQQLPVDYVKIDGGHVRAIAKDSRQRAITAGIVRLCGDLEIGTIAEMIESEDQATVLEDMGVGFGQGWLFGRPVDRLP